MISIEEAINAVKSNTEQAKEILRLSEENEIKINLSDSEAISMSLMQSLQLNAGSYSLSSPDTLSLESLAQTIMDIIKIEVEIIKDSNGINHFDSIREFP